MTGAGAHVRLGEDRGQTGRTTGREGPSCRRCGDAIRGRRRNGCCSDRCRMRDRRGEGRARVDELLQRLDADVQALRDELVGEVEP